MCPELVVLFYFFSYTVLIVIVTKDTNARFIFDDNRITSTELYTKLFFIVFITS